jgi:hypothetical protein
MNPTKKPDPKSGLPKPRPDGQPAQEDNTTGDEGGGGFYGPQGAEDEEQRNRRGASREPDRPSPR